MYKVIAFDLDGTLVDSIHDIAHCMNKVLEENDLPTHPLESYHNFIGEGALVLAEKASNNHTNSQFFFEQYSKYADVLCTEYSVLFDNVIEVLNTLKKYYKLAVITNKPIVQAKKVIEHFFNDMFDFVFAQEEGKDKKPNVAPMTLLLDEFSLESKDVLYVGDSHVDFEFASNSNTDVLILTYGYHKEGFLETLNNKYKIDKFEEILKKIK